MIIYEPYITKQETAIIINAIKTASKYGCILDQSKYIIKDIIPKPIQDMVVINMALCLDLSQGLISFLSFIL